MTTQRWIVLGISIVIVIGASFSWWTAIETDRSQRIDLLLQGRLIAEAIDLEQVKALTGTEADLSLPAYQKLKDRMARSRAVLPDCRFMYLMGRRPDGKVIFLVDSEPASSADYSPPGQVYEEASAELRGLFDSRRPEVQGPVSDRWGSWVSALVPLVDHRTGKVLALLGMDIKAGLWNLQVIGKAAVPSGLAVLVLLFAFFFFKSQHDNREIKRRDEALKASETLYRVLFESMTQGVIYQNQTGEITNANPAAERILSFSLDELKKQPLKTLGWGAVREDGSPLSAEESPSAEVLRSGKPVLGRIIGVSPPGSNDKRWIMVDAIPEFRPNQTEPFRIFTIFTDLTERKQTEIQLRESEEKFRSIIEQMSEVVALVDEHGVVTFVSPIIEQVSGFRPEQVIGRPFVDFVAEQDLPVVQAATSYALAHHLPEINLELHLKRKDGSLFQGEISAALVYHGETIKITAIIHDISERKRAEEEREKLKAQLVQAQKMESIGRLAGGVAHDFNNLLTGITGYTEMLLDGLDERHPMRDDLNEIKRAAARAAALTAQLLAFSRKQVIDPRVIDLNELVADSAKMLERVIGEDVKFAFYPGPNLARIKVDPHQIEQILINLAINARDAMPNGGQLTIETRNVEADEYLVHRHIDAEQRDYVMLAVSDNGCGMSEEVQQHLFEPFFTTKEKGKGTGLGLSMIYGIVKQNEGFIAVYSEPGVGSTFKIHLPAVAETAIAADPAQLKNLPGGRETILLVEDEDTVRNFTRKLLMRHGYQVISAGLAEEALRLAEDPKVTFDLLLTDVVMPVMNGRELHQRLLAMRPGLRVLFMSGYPENAIAKHGVLEPGTSFVQKPFTIEQLLGQIRRTLDCARK